MSGIEVGDELVIDGGMSSFVVIEKTGNDLNCKCIDAGLFLPGAKFSSWRDGKLVRRNYKLPTLSTKVYFSAKRLFSRRTCIFWYNSLNSVAMSFKSFPDMFYLINLSTGLG